MYRAAPRRLPRPSLLPPPPPPSSSSSSSSSTDILFPLTPFLSLPLPVVSSTNVARSPISAEVEGVAYRTIVTYSPSSARGVVFKRRDLEPPSGMYRFLWRLDKRASTKANDPDCTKGRQIGWLDGKTLRQHMYEEKGKPDSMIIPRWRLIEKVVPKAVFARPQAHHAFKFDRRGGYPSEIQDRKGCITLTYTRDMLLLRLQLFRWWNTRPKLKGKIWGWDDLDKAVLLSSDCINMVYLTTIDDVRADEISFWLLQMALETSDSTDDEWAYLLVGKSHTEPGQFWLFERWLMQFRLDTVLGSRCASNPYVDHLKVVNEYELKATYTSVPTAARYNWSITPRHCRCRLSPEQHRHPEVKPMQPTLIRSDWEYHRQYLEDLRESTKEQNLTIWSIPFEEATMYMKDMKRYSGFLHAGNYYIVFTAQQLQDHRHSVIIRSTVDATFKGLVKSHGKWWKRNHHRHEVLGTRTKRKNAADAFDVFDKEVKRLKEAEAKSTAGVTSNTAFYAVPYAPKLTADKLTVLEPPCITQLHGKHLKDKERYLYTTWMFKFGRTPVDVERRWRFAMGGNASVFKGIMTSVKWNHKRRGEKSWKQRLPTGCRKLQEQGLCADPKCGQKLGWMMPPRNPVEYSVRRITLGALNPKSKTKKRSREEDPGLPRVKLEIEEDVVVVAVKPDPGPDPIPYWLNPDL